MPINKERLSVASLLLMLVGIACARPSGSQDMTFPATVVFDDSLHRFYAYGVIGL
jgi:hypothetical protein